MVRPLRFAFAVEPKDKASLQRVFETNSALWGGLFNFIIPLFRPSKTICHFSSGVSLVLSAFSAFSPPGGGPKPS